MAFFTQGASLCCKEGHRRREDGGSDVPSPFHLSLPIRTLKVENLVGCAGIKVQGKNRCVCFVRCFHCSGMKKMHMHREATKYTLCDFW